MTHQLSRWSAFHAMTGVVLWTCGSSFTEVATLDVCFVASNQSTILEYSQITCVILLYRKQIVVNCSYMEKWQYATVHNIM